MSTFNIDFFEFSFLVEACIPPRPIARSMFWDDVINIYYHQMTQDERERLLEWIQRHPSFKLEDDQCRMFKLRFDPDNQYLVKTRFNGEETEKQAFLVGDRYHTSKSVSINTDYIIEIIKI